MAADRRVGGSGALSWMRGAQAWACALIAFALALGGCLDVQTGGPSEAPTPAALAPRLSLTPAEAVPGQQLTAHVEGIHVDFKPGLTISLGEGVTPGNATILSPTAFQIPLVVDAGAVVGYRDLTVSLPDEGAVQLKNALLLQTGHLFVSPAAADRGQSVAVEVQASGVALTPGYSWVDFGEGIETEAFTVGPDGTGSALLRIASSAVPGPRDVSLTEGPTRIRLKEGFTVGRGLVAVQVSPQLVNQGEREVVFTVTGYNTHFEPGRTAVDFGVGFAIDAADPTAVVVEGPEKMSVKVKVCRAAIPGLHRLTVSTLGAGGDLEIVSAEDPVEVLEVPGTVAEGYGSFNLSLQRTFTPTGIEESVSASGTFSVVAGSCESGNGSSCGVSTPPYDQPVFYPPPGCTPESNTVLNPPPPSLDAGPSIFLEALGGQIVIRLDKNVDTDGTFYYGLTEAVPLEDFRFNTAYSVRIPGGRGASAVEATVLKDIILTPPKDYFVRAPDLSLAPTLNPYDALLTRWEDQDGNPGTGSFPVASLSITVRTNAALDGALSQISQIPLDDGVYSVPAAFMSQLYPGAGRMIFSLTRIGPVYGLPGSAYRSYATSNVSYSGLLEIRE